MLLEVDGHALEVEAALFNTLPMLVLLGTINSELLDLLCIGQGCFSGD